MCIDYNNYAGIVDNANLVDMNSKFLDYLTDKDRLHSALDLLVIHA